MLIYRDGRCVGTIGGGCMEARVIQIARLMAAGEGEQARICHVDMTGNEAEEEVWSVAGKWMYFWKSSKRGKQNHRRH